jgi:hypothetical protein
MDGALAHHRHHRQRTRAREALLSQQPLHLNATTRSPRVIRGPGLQHNRAPIVEPHRSHFCHRIRDEQLLNRHSAQHLSTPLNSPRRHLHDPANTAIQAGKEDARYHTACRLPTKDRGGIGIGQENFAIGHMPSCTAIRVTMIVRTSDLDHG